MFARFQKFLKHQWLDTCGFWGVIQVERICLSMTKYRSSLSLDCVTWYGQLEDMWRKSALWIGKRNRTGNYRIIEGTGSTLSGRNRPIHHTTIHQTTIQYTTKNNTTQPHTKRHCSTLLCVTKDAADTVLCYSSGYSSPGQFSPGLVLPVTSQDWKRLCCIQLCFRSVLIYISVRNIPLMWDICY